MRGAAGLRGGGDARGAAAALGRAACGGAAGRVQRFRMLEVIWVNLDVTFNVFVSPEILLLHFMS